MTVAHRLTERDRIILTMLYRHRVFTTDQLAEMYFDNLNTAQHRLTTLYKLRLVDRFQPLDHRYASLPYHYVLDQLGAMVVAAERGEDPDKSRWRADKALAIGKSQRLRHLVGVNGFFSALAAESRRRDDCDLSLWWSERHCTSQFDRIAQPDGLGVWEEAGNRVVFCLEYDRSTESLERLGKEPKSYEDLQVASGLAYWILFCFGHPRREAEARRVLAQATVPVATAAMGPTQRPQAAIWAPIGGEGLRCAWPNWPACPFRGSRRSASQRLRRTGAGRSGSSSERSAAQAPRRLRGHMCVARRSSWSRWFPGSMTSWLLPSESPSSIGWSSPSEGYSSRSTHLLRRRLEVLFLSAQIFVEHPLNSDFAARHSRSLPVVFEGLAHGSRTTKEPYGG
jgi:hypothetical protein